jgi:hypothetical protein
MSITLEFVPRKHAVQLHLFSWIFMNGPFRGGIDTAIRLKL